MNAPPTSSAISNLTVNEDAAPSNIILTNYFTDAEDGAAGLAYSIQGNTNTGLFTSTTIVSGQLALAYASDQSGSANLTIRATDSGGLFAERTFTVTVLAINDPPVLTVNTGLSALEAQSLVLTAANLLATDVDSTASQLTYTLNSLPVHGVLQKNFVPLGLLGSFTQQDVLDGLVRYVHDGSESTTESFGFQLSDGAGGSLTRVSLGLGGAQANGESSYASLSTDGRYMAFMSNATNLVIGDNDAFVDVFVRDLQTGTTTLVSTGSAGKANTNSVAPAISANGRFVVFLSTATNLTPNDSDDIEDVFVRDLQTGTTTLVSTGSAGKGNNGSSYGLTPTHPTISADGRFVAFSSYSDNLSPDDNDLNEDVFVKDLQTGAIVLVSQGIHGKGNYHSYSPWISADGRYVAFTSSASNLSDDDPDFWDNVYVRDLQTGTTSLLDIGPDGKAAGASYAYGISADGRLTSFITYAPNLLYEDQDTVIDVLVGNVETRTLALASKGVGGKGDAYSLEAAISADGRFVTFTSYADNLVPENPVFDYITDVYKHDMLTGTTTLLNWGSMGLANAPSGQTSMSGDGRLVAYGSGASNLVPGDTNGFSDVFLHDSGVLSGVVSIGIMPVNDAPTLNAIGDPAPIDENSGEQIISVSGITAGGGESQLLVVSATSSNPSLVPNPTVNYASASTTGTLRYTPAAYHSGTAVITVSVQDSGGTADGGVNSTVRTFTVVVNNSAGPIVTALYAADAAGVALEQPILQDEREISTIPKLAVVFSESMARTGMANVNSAHNWQLKSSGVDLSSEISGISFGYNATANRYEALLSFTSPLLDGSYELTARSTLTDLAGNRLDGDFDGSGFGEDYSHRFTISQPLAAGSEFRVNAYTTNRQTLPAVASDGAGNFIVVWDSSIQDNGTGGIYAQRYTSTGAPLGSEFRVNSTSPNPQEVPSVSMNAAGAFVVTWTSIFQDGSLRGVYGQRFDASGTPQGGEFRVNSYTTLAQSDTRVAINSSGDFVVTWMSDSQDGSDLGIYAQCYNSAGLKVGTEFRVNTYTTSTQRVPAVAIADDGDFAIVWQSTGEDGDGHGVYGQRYNAGGSPLGSEFRINTYTTGPQVRPDVAMTPDGDFVVAWHSFQDGSVFGYGVYAQRYDASGMALGSEFRVNTYLTSSQSIPRVAVDVDGDFAVTWTSTAQDGNSFGVFAQRFNSAGVPQGSEFRVNSYTTDTQQNSVLAMDSDGDFVAAWYSNAQDGDGHGIYAQRYSASATVRSVQVSGATIEIEPGERLVQTIADGPSVSATFSRDMSQAGGAAGATSVTNPTNWMLTQNGTNISGQISSVSCSGTTATLTLSATLGDGNYALTAKSTIQDADGRALDGDGNGSPGGDFTRAFSIQQPVAAGSEFRVNSYTTGYQELFPANAIATNAAGDFVITWSSPQDGSGYGVYAARYNAAGAPIGSEFRVNSYTMSSQRNSSIAMDSRGNFVVTWAGAGQDGSLYGIYAQRYNADGVPQGTEFQVNTYTTSDQQAGRVAMNSAGDFVIAWGSNGQDGSGLGIYAQRYNSAGLPLGSEFRVNTYTTGGQYVPSVALDGRGDFIISWRSIGQDGDGYGAFAQRYNAAGEPQGSEFQVNTYTTGSQFNPVVATDASGNFVIVWGSSLQDSGTYGIYAQRYDSIGMSQGSEFRVNSYTTGTQRVPRVAMDYDGDFVITWSSVGQDGSSDGIFAQRFDSAGVKVGSELRVNTYTSNKQASSSVAMDEDGDFVICWMSDGQDGGNYGVYAQRFSAAPPVQVLSITPTYAGFSLQFNRDFDASALNLYDQGGAFGVADVTLIGASTGAVRGSVVIDPGSRKLTFIKSGGPLVPDTYTINLRSNATGFVDTSGNLLDGNRDGFAGDDYVTRFTITPPPTGVTLAVSDVVRGHGQVVNLPASASTGVPITIGNAVGIRSASFAVVYDPALLTITGATAGSGITGAVSLDTSIYGVARITVTSPTQLSAAAGLQTLVKLSATVPVNASYASKQILELSSVELLDTSLAKVAAIDDDGIHIATFLGDANADQSYNSPDATLTQRLIVGLDTGLSSYQLADPYLIADINSNGQVQSDDVTQIQRAIVGLSTTDIPALPGLGPAPAGGPDPIVSITQNLTASVGETVTVPVELRVTEPTGITLAGADLAIAYDSSTLELTDADVGQLLVGFGLSVNAATPGVIRLSLAGSPLDLDYNASGVLATLRFTVIAGAGTTSNINLLQSSASLHTALYDAAGRPMTLSPAPTNAANDTVDGRLTIEPSARLEVIDTLFASEDLSADSDWV